LSVTSPNADFPNSCIDRFLSKFAIEAFLNIPTYLKGVTTLPCEILRSENSDNVKCTVISKKSQGSVAAHLRCGGYSAII